MKKYIFKAIKCFTLLMLMIIFNHTNAKSPKEILKQKLDTLKLSATAMECLTDRKMVETSLYRKSGVKQVEIKDETIIVIFNSTKISKEMIIELIENTGTCENPNAKVHKVKIKTN